MRRLESVYHHYRFHIQAFAGRAGPGFQLLVGMVDDPHFELVPVHRTAFAQRFELAEFHRTQADVHLELTGLLEWLAARRAGRRRA